MLASNNHAGIRLVQRLSAGLSVTLAGNHPLLRSPFGPEAANPFDLRRRLDFNGEIT